jgi:hypothetical protein
MHVRRCRIRGSSDAHVHVARQEREGLIRVARLSVTAGMIVGDDDCRGVGVQPRIGNVPGRYLISNRVEA